MSQLVLKNGHVVLSESVINADVVIENGKIAEISKSGFSGKAKREIDCSGKHILPGCIDVHVHFREPGLTHKEDFSTGSVAALAGGVTTILDMPNTLPPTVTIEALRDKNDLAKEKCKCNFGFHFGVSEHHFNEIRKATREPNVHSFKAYVGESTGDMRVPYDLLEHVFEETPKVITVHAEDHFFIKENEEKFKGSQDPSVHSLIRSEVCAEEAVKHVLHLAKKHDHKVHIAHVSTALELIVIRKFKNQNVTCEVTPHHLFLNIGEYEKQGNFVKTNPPLRTRSDQEALWAAIDDGTVDIIASDHAPHTFAEKDVTYSVAPSGVPGVETMLPLLLNEVNRGRLTINKVTDLLAKRPAEIFGFSGKGVIATGMDADFVICDMGLLKVIENDHLKTKCRWSPFNGWELKGWPVITICGGEVFEF